MSQAMRHIDEGRLESDVQYRFGYVSEFVGLTEADVGTILGAKALLAPVVGGLVDAVYVKLFGYDCTKRHFVPKQSGYEGETPVDIDELTLDHPMVEFRKGHLRNYLVRLVSGPYDEKMISYLDRVGAIHTAAVGSAKLDVPLVQMNALLGWVADAVTATIQAMDIPQAKKDEAVRAFGKLLWIQNDLIVRHYQRDALPA